MASDDPPYLELGTEVSAKYRGAFCEAKVKIVQRCVKVKVNVGKGSPIIVDHDAIKEGALKIGSKVVIKAKDGTLSSGIITKLNDASVYTVVFDDGDERTLKRSSLVLKGGRHYHESETLDTLPLTNPENFGSPVGRQARRRGRPTPPGDSGASLSSISPKRRRSRHRFTIGQVVFLENDRRKASWLPAVVVPSTLVTGEAESHDDSLYVRSFKDGRFYSVEVKDLHEFSESEEPLRNILSGDLQIPQSHRLGIDKALNYIRTNKLPWDMDLSSQEHTVQNIMSFPRLQLESSPESVSESREDEKEDDDADDNESGSGEEDSDSEDDSEAESVDENMKEKSKFMEALIKFHRSRGTPIIRHPVMGQRNVDLFKLYHFVKEFGGMEKVTKNLKWRQIYLRLGLPANQTNCSSAIKQAYKRYLLPFQDEHEKTDKKADTNQQPPPISSPVENLLSPNGRLTSPTPGPSVPPANHTSPLQETLPQASIPQTSSPQKNTPQKSTPKKVTPQAPTLQTATPQASPQQTPAQQTPAQQTPTQETPAQQTPTQQTLPPQASTPVKEDIPQAEQVVDHSELPVQGPSQPSPEEGKDVVESMEEATPPGSKKEEDLLKSCTPVKEEENKTKQVEERQEVNKGTYSVDDKILVAYGKGRKPSTYEAKIIDVSYDKDPDETMYLVHYNGWNKRYNEWIHESRVIGKVSGNTFSVRQYYKKKPPKRMSSESADGVDRKEDSAETIQPPKKKRGRPQKVPGGVAKRRTSSKPAVQNTQPSRNDSVDDSSSGNHQTLTLPPSNSSPESPSASTREEKVHSSPEEVSPAVRLDYENKEDSFEVSEPVSVVDTSEDDGEKAVKDTPSLQSGEDGSRGQLSPEGSRLRASSDAHSSSGLEEMNKEEPVPKLENEDKSEPLPQLEHMDDTPVRGESRDDLHNNASLHKSTPSCDDEDSAVEGPLDSEVAVPMEEESQPEQDEKKPFLDNTDVGVTMSGSRTSGVETSDDGTSGAEVNQRSVGVVNETQDVDPLEQQSTQVLDPLEQQSTPETCAVENEDDLPTLEQLTKTRKSDNEDDNVRSEEMLTEDVQSSDQEQQQGQEEFDTPAKEEESVLSSHSSTSHSKKIHSGSVEGRKKLKRSPRQDEESPRKRIATLPNDATNPWILDFSAMPNMVPSEKIHVILIKMKEMRQCYSELRAKVGHIERKKRRAKRREKELQAQSQVRQQLLSSQLSPSPALLESQ